MSCDRIRPCRCRLRGNECVSAGPNVSGSRGCRGIIVFRSTPSNTITRGHTQGKFDNHLYHKYTKSWNSLDIGSVKVMAKKTTNLSVSSSFHAAVDLRPPSIFPAFVLRVRTLLKTQPWPWPLLDTQWAAREEDEDDREEVNST